jgi:ubiquinone/menaquinone biosynthesis C-methylase UbiE
MGSKILLDLKDYYKRSEGYKTHLTAKEAAFFHRFVSVVCSVTADEDAILDLGCGAGQSTREIAQRRKNVVGVDLSSTFLHGAAESCESKMMFAAGDAAHLPFADNKFNLVCSMEFIEHVWPVDAVLREMIRVIAPGGRIIISSPSLLSPLRPVFDLPRMLLKGIFRPPHYGDFAGAGKYFIESVSQSARKYLSRTPQFLYREPDFEHADGGGDFDAVYKSHPSDLVAFFRNEDLSVRFAVGSASSSKEWIRMRLGATLAPVWTSFILIATKPLRHGRSKQNGTDTLP